MKKEIFLEHYQQLMQTLVLKDFTGLNEDDLKQIELLKSHATQIYQDIVTARQIGTDYLYAGLTYFSVGTTVSLTAAQYFVLRVSYFFYVQYQAMVQLPGSQAKQKEIFDLLRYIAKPILEQDQNQQLVEESKKLLQLYLKSMLKQPKLDKTIYVVWDEYIQATNFKDKKVLNHLRALTIIFKRLAQQKIVRRQRKKRKRTINWPSKQQLINYRRKRQGQQILVDYPAQITAVQQAVLDEDGDLDISDPSIVIHTTDVGTARFGQVLNQHVEHLLRHRQRRLQPFVTNPHYMSEDVIRHLIYILNLELNNSHTNKAAIAAACLLSLTTGLSPVALLDYSQLIEEGVLIKNNNHKKPEYCLRLHLDITKQKIEILKQYQLNHTVSHDLHLSSSWFDYLNLRSSREVVTVNEVNKYLKKWSGKQQIGSITVEKLQAQLYFHVFHRTFNEYIAHVLSGKDSHHDLPSSFYNGVAQHFLNEHYLIYLNTLTTPDIAAEMQAVQQQFKTYAPSEDARFGSQLALTPHFVTNFFVQLKQVCNEKIQLHHHVIDRVNAYSAWMWHISLLCLTRRPKENLLGHFSDYDLRLKFLYVDDKKNSQSRKDGRFIPLPNFFIQAFNRYIDFLHSVVDNYADLLKFVFNKRITLEDIFGQVIVYPKELPVIAQHWASKKIKIRPLDRSWVNNYLSQHLSQNLYNNWLRHFDMNKLMEQGVAFNVIQALYGHDQRDQELFYRYSSASLQQYMVQVTRGIDDMITSLHIEHLS